ncbi:dihydrofolate reductase [Legionella cincinnatiensis]|uniref:Dihydrofolate reductase n=1 Tax=Legionella cincinnatiensis TaxID=28085 RepID=A0A378IGP9_9GAMM|nr:dihydrofolate reductase [Legionella cincinnatiensis]KTC86274.1 dihydrofolate reductase FolA [Legionella cincinnatiensis]STX33885.1 dihydrofolate reductase FolA [Legionella cincinnatiensis]
MTIISLIAAIDESGGLGINNQLLCHAPADLQHFKSMTMGKPVIMGRKTFASIGRPLPGRLNIVLSRTSSLIEGVHVFDSLKKAIEYAEGHYEIMIIGGAELFNEAIEMATFLYITRIHHQFAADVFFPKIDESIWHCQNQQFRPQDEKNKYDMTFCFYERNR